MFRSAIALLLVAAPASVAWGQKEDVEGWALSAMSNGCMVQAVSPQGTMLSIWGFAGEERLGVLLQNRGWSVEDGRQTPLQVEFLGQRTWPVEATAREEIDADGPGFYFTLEPGAPDANGFLKSFTSSEGMRIRRDGQSVDTLSLAGSRPAIAAFARCLAERWASAPPSAPEARPEPQTGTTI
jgi:hypothetical protein